MAFPGQDCSVQVVEVRLRTPHVQPGWRGPQHSGARRFGRTSHAGSRASWESLEGESQQACFLDLHQGFHPDLGLSTENPSTKHSGAHRTTGRQGRQGDCGLAAPAAGRTV